MDEGLVRVCLDPVRGKEGCSRCLVGGVLVGEGSEFEFESPCVRLVPMSISGQESPEHITLREHTVILLLPGPFRGL